MPNNVPDVIFFIGAGFSKPAGVPLMSEFVTLFEKRLKQKGDDYHNYFLTIKKSMTKTSGSNQPDLEVLMDILSRLANGNTLEMSAWQEKDELSAFNEEIRKDTKSELENLIREKCIIDPDAKLNDYSPLNDVFKTIKPLDIFSVNYDDVLEVFCYKNKYTLEDGFALYWDPSRLSNLVGIDVRLLKLHGSVLWYRTEEGAFYKVLLKVPPEYNKLITGEKLEQLIAYPVAGKPIHVAPLAYAMNELRKRLEEVSQCIIIGYSMRDNHIIDIFIEALRRNDKLRIILVNPDPFSILKQIENKALLRSIIPASFETKEILHTNKILTISSFVRKIAERPLFESIKNPFKAAQEYFEALDYENAFRLMKIPKNEQYYNNIMVRDLSYSKLLAGLLYVRVISRYIEDELLENEVRDFIIGFLRKVARNIDWDNEVRLLVGRSKDAILWVINNLQGSVSKLTHEFADCKISALDYALERLEGLKDVKEIKKFTSETCLSLIKRTNERIWLDRKQHTWLFE
jgi:DNA-binding ferritin-like protein (Dps family)